MSFNVQQKITHEHSISRKNNYDKRAPLSGTGDHAERSDRPLAGGFLVPSIPPRNHQLNACQQPPFTTAATLGRGPRTAVTETQDVALALDLPAAEQARRNPVQFCFSWPLGRRTAHYNSTGCFNC